MINSQGKQLKTLSFVKRWDHHTQSGGYDRLADYIDAEILTIKELPYLRLQERGVTQKMIRLFMPDSHYSNHYNLKNLLAENQIVKKVKTQSLSLVHAFYAEDQLNRILSERNKLKAALTGTLHLPVESHFIQRLIRADKIKRYKELDSIIVLSSGMVSEIKHYTGNPEVYFVPHGIDVQSFTPPHHFSEKPDKLFTVLTVGRHARDWETFSKVVKSLENYSDRIKFTAVLPEKIGQSLQRSLNINTYSSIPESRLIELYHEADLLYMPLTYATANNSILEAMACGTPVLSTNTGGIPDYVNKHCSWLVPEKDVSKTAELILSLSQNLPIVKQASCEARKQALEFDWVKIASQVLDVYQNAWQRWRHH